MPELMQATAELPRSAAPVGPAEYQRLIARVREEVARVVPSESTVLVVSRGDEELVRFPNHHGWHFPRASGGEYGGYHPQSGVEAVSHLEDLRAAGASHIVFPSTAFWWFDYYSDLASYLQANSRLVAHRGDACLIFAFEGSVEERRPRSPAPPAPASDVGDAEWSQLRGLVDSLLPETCAVLVATEEEGVLPPLGGRKVWRFGLSVPDLPMRLEEDDSVDRLKGLQSAGADYLVVSKELDGFVRSNPVLRAYLAGHCRVITRQRHAGTIFALRTPVHGKSAGRPA
ncbi:MAG: hypothetical protein ACRELU_11600 [Gemmatimonadota bacterium]